MTLEFRPSRLIALAFACAAPQAAAQTELWSAQLGTPQTEHTYALALDGAGATLHAQVWARDPAYPDGFLLSDGWTFSVCP